MFDAKKLIVGGSTATKGEYPWLVNIILININLKLDRQAGSSRQGERQTNR